VALDAGDDAGVPGDLGVPAACGGVVAQRGEVGELGLELRDEFGGGDVVVALLADVGVGAGLGGELAGAVPVRDPGFSILARSYSTRPGMMGWPAGAMARASRERALPIASS
jgi:hypothetical protein